MYERHNVFSTILKSMAQQTLHVYSTLKRRGNGRFHVVSTWNTGGVFLRGILRGAHSKPFIKISGILLLIVRFVKCSDQTIIQIISKNKSVFS